MAEKKAESGKKINGPVGSRSGNHTKKLFDLNLKHKEAHDPAIVQIRSADGQTVLDSLDATYEDSFCLDTFKDLIIAHQQAGKHFIIARVQTWDRKQPDKAYYSYYNAYHLNKILFQTQWKGDKRLIHRLNVLNPLTNTDIIGEVQYFLVITKYNAPVSDKVANLLAEVLANNITVPQNTEELDKRQLPKRLKSTSEEVSFRLNYYVKKTLPPKLSVKTSTSRELGPGCDDLLLGSAQVDPNENNQKVAAEENKGDSEKAVIITVANPGEQPNNNDNSSATTTSNPSNFTGGDSSTSHSRKINQFVRPTPETSIEMRPISNTKKLTINTTGMERPRINSKTIQKAITQFNEPVPPELIKDIAPPNDEEKRNKVFLNSPIATNNPWNHNVVVGGGGGGDNDSSPSTPIKNVQDLNAWESTLKRINSGIQDDDIYDAILVGTDNDYLETSRLRGIFRENAILDADVTLFEMAQDAETFMRNQMPQSPIDLEFRTRNYWHQLIHVPPAIVLAGMSFPLQIFHQTKFYLFTIIVVALLVFIIFRIDRN